MSESFDCPVAPGEWTEPETALETAMRELTEGTAEIRVTALDNIHEGAERIVAEWSEKAAKIMGGKP